MSTEVKKCSIRLSANLIAIVGWSSLAINMSYAQVALREDPQIQWDRVHAGTVDAGRGDGSVVEQVFITAQAPEPYRSLYLRWVGKIENEFVSLAMVPYLEPRSRCRLEFAVDHLGLVMNPPPICLNDFPSRGEAEKNEANTTVVMLENMQPPDFHGTDTRRFHMTLDSTSATDFAYVLDADAARIEALGTALFESETEWIQSHIWPTSSCDSPPYTLDISAEAPGRVGAYYVDWLNGLGARIAESLASSAKTSSGSIDIIFSVDQNGIVRKPAPRQGLDYKNRSEPFHTPQWESALDELRRLSAPPFPSWAVDAQIDRIRIFGRLEIRKGGRVEIARGADLLPWPGTGHMCYKD